MRSRYYRFFFAKPNSHNVPNSRPGLPCRHSTGVEQSAVGVPATKSFPTFRESCHYNLCICNNNNIIIIIIFSPPSQSL